MLKPLLPFLTAEGHFYILALSQNLVRLLQGTCYTIQEVLLPEEVPESLAVALQYDQPEQEMQYHSGATGAALGERERQSLVFHGIGAHDKTKKDLARYLQRVNRGLHELLHDETAPLVLAGVEYLVALYRRVNTYPHLLEEDLTGNPDEASAQDLHERAWRLERHSRPLCGGNGDLSGVRRQDRAVDPIVRGWRLPGLHALASWHGGPLVASS